MQPVDFVGSFAAFFSTISFVPQVWKTLKTRDTQSISLLMYSLFLIGVLAWLTWALMLSQWPAVAANTVTALLAAIVFTLKVHAVVVKKEKP